MPAMTRRTGIVAAIGTSETIAWASSYYLPAVLAAPIAASLHLPQSLFFGIFSASLLLAAALGPTVGRLIDLGGGRAILAASNVVLAAGLMVLAAANGAFGLVAAWILLGIGIAMGLYDPAFAVLTRLYGREARASITGVTLIAGFASTVGWPLSAFVAAHFGWRAACLMWAGLNLGLALPLNRLAVPKPPPSPIATMAATPADDEDPPAGAMPILAFYFSATWFVTGAMAAHLPRLLERAGATPLQAITAAALVGPAQVAARLVEFFLLRRAHPLISARIAALLHPIGAVILAAAGPVGAVAFAIFYGAGNGLLTIARGTVPLAVFGPHGYGERTGLLGAPSRAAQALAPLLFGLLLDTMGVSVIAVSSALCLAAFAALIWLHAAQPE
jgi:predicted MFS family arabinose efflux permease